MKEILKAYFITEYDLNYFSLGNCSVTTARKFLDYLIEFALKHDISLSESGLERTDNIDRYLWICLKHRKCAICGAKADLHHVQAIGAGRNRKTVDDSKNLKMALCRSIAFYVCD